MDTKNKVSDLKKMLEGKKKKKKVETHEDDLKEANDKLLRTLADFENYKKRIHKEQANLAKHSAERFVKELLPILDDFDRIFDHLPKKPNGETKSLVDGTKLIHSNLLKCLKSFDVEEVKTIGEKFDPHLHEAITQEESDQKSGNITKCHRKGYTLHDRLLRPAMVTVAK